MSRKSRDSLELDIALTEIKTAKEKLAKLRKVVQQIQENSSAKNDAVCDGELAKNTERMKKLVMKTRKA